MNVYVQAYQQFFLQWSLSKLRIVFAILFDFAGIHRSMPLLKANANSMPDAEKPAGEGATFTTLTIKNNNKTELLRFSEIICLQSEHSYVEIQTIRKKYVLYRSLRSIEQELDAQQFVRVHRSAIVNRNFILSIAQLPGGDGFVTLTTGEEIHYSRNYKNELLS